MERREDVVVEYKLGVGGESFELEKAVCSHGFFMTAPNHWDPLSKTLQRPLRLYSSSSVTVQISQPPQTSSHLLVRVFDTPSLPPAHHQSLMDQVRRMLRLSEAEERNVREFQEMYYGHGEAEAKSSGLGLGLGLGFGRIFRSPTLFEDMVKSILVCNCQWSRTLSMARALCELQLELQSPTSTEADKNKTESPTAKFAPNTPAGKEPNKRKMITVKDTSRNVSKKVESDAILSVDFSEPVTCTNNTQEAKENYGFMSEKTELPFDSGIGNFPSPEELASLDVNFLQKRCNLGYRASRIVGLAQSVVEGRIKLRELEQDCSLSNYMKLNQQLAEINGFGPFTCANVLMCMGFYHVIPSDSETLRHLNQVHGTKSTIKNIEKDIERIYGKYAPFQFLVYWSEIWSFYEERFGKLSEVPNSQYKLITAANMKSKTQKKKKK